MRVLLDLQELARAVEQALRHLPVPGPDRDVGHRVVVAGDVAPGGQQPVEHIELALGLHRVAVDRVLELFRRVGIEMPEAAADEGRAAHLPEQPRQAFGARGRRGGQQGAELLGQMHQDRAGLEDPDRLRAAAVEQRRDLRVRIDLDEAAAELLAVADLHQPGVVFRAGMAQREQLLQHHRDLHAIGRAQRVELQRMAPDRQRPLVRGAGHRPVDAGELAAAGGVPGPDGGRGPGRVGGGGGHGRCRQDRSGWGRASGHSTGSAPRLQDQGRLPTIPAR